MSRTLLTLALLTALASAQVDAPLQPTQSVITDVVLSTAEDAPHVDITILAGRITAIEPTGGELPAGAKLYDGAGRLAQPGFIDTWTTSGVETPSPVATQDEPVDVRGDVRSAMREANRKGIEPSFRAAEVLDFGADGASAWRAEGFGALLAAPSGELLAGHGALCVTRAGARRDLVLNPSVFQFGAFAASGRGFPSTLMGDFAQLRQVFYDAGWNAELAKRYEAGKREPRPAWDPELESTAKLTAGRELYVVRAQSTGDIERWLRLADEFKLRIAIAGGAEAWPLAERLQALGVPVLLDMDFGEEVDDPAEREASGPVDDESPDDRASDEDAGASSRPSDVAPSITELDPEDPWHYEEPEALKLERRRLWEERRDNAKRLSAAGVRILFATGDRKPKQLMADLRTAVAAGLDPEVCRRALTADAARFLGMTDHLGELVVGADANLGLWTADPLGEDASLALIVVDGHVEEYDVVAPGAGPAEGVDASGVWTLQIDSEDAPEGPTLTLEMDDEGHVSGSVNMTSPMSGEAMSTAVKGSVSDTTLELKGEFDMGEFALEFRVTAELNADALSGTSTWAGPWGEETSKLSGTRPPSRHRQATEETETHYSCKD